jgi:hypothetical protein
MMMENLPIKDITVYRDPKIVLEEARRAAEALTDVVKAKLKKVIINDEQYLEFEDWQTLGRFYGLTVKVQWTKPVILEGVRGWEAQAVILDRDGNIISSAEAMCLNDEEKWSSKPKYEYQYVLKDGSKSIENPPKEQIVWVDNPNKPGKKMPKKERVKVADQPVPSFQLRSMAQTRACAKAFRNVLAWVVVLAGYKPTPAEEMQGVVDVEPTENVEPNGKSEIQSESETETQTSPSQPLQEQINFLEQMKRYKAMVGLEKYKEILTGRYSAMKPEDVKPEDQASILKEIEVAYKERIKK